MKNKKLLLLPFLALLLAGCKPSSSSSTPPDSSGPDTSQPGTTDSSSTEVPGTSDSDDPLPTIPSEPPVVIETMSIKDAREKADGTTVSVQGTVTGIYGMASLKFGIIIQEGDHAITLTFVEADEAALHKVGDHIFAEGKTNNFNGLVQLTDSKITKSEKAAATIVPHVLTSWDKTALTGMDGRLVKAEGLIKVSGSVVTNANSDIKVKFPDSTTEFSLYVSNYIDMAEKEALVAKINTMKSSDTINFEGPIGWYTNPQLNPIYASTVTIVEGQSTGPVAPTKVSFIPSSAVLRVGETKTAVATVEPSDAEYDGIAYSSENDLVATVTEAGLVTAVAEGKTNIVATVGTLTGKFAVTVIRSLDGIASVYKLDFSNGDALLESSKEEGKYYNYYTDFEVKITDGKTPLNWKVRGFNPNDWAAPGVRFGGKSGDDKLDKLISSGLPMSAAVAAALAGTYTQSLQPVPGEVNDISVIIQDIWSSGVTVDKIYVQASADAAFTTPINIGAKSYGIGEVVFPLETPLVDHYYRVIFGMVITASNNTPIIVNSVSFNKNSNEVLPEDKTVTALAFSDEQLALVVGEQKATSLLVNPENGDVTGLEYKSSVPAVATVDGEGKVSALTAGTTVISAELGELKAELTVTVTVGELRETQYLLDMSKASAMLETDQTGSNYSYANQYTIKMTDGTTALNWKASGINPNNWNGPGIRFGGKNSNTKLSGIITTGLPMEPALADKLAAAFVQSLDAVPGEVNEVVVDVTQLYNGATKISLDKIYVQASADAAFTAPINIGAQAYSEVGSFTFAMDEALTDHYFRIIIGLEALTKDNVFTIVSGVSFNKVS